MIRYEFKGPLTIRSAANADPQKIGEALAALTAPDGSLDVHIVPEAARDPASPMHHQFTWDDAEAARERRVDQARELVRSIRVVGVGNEPPRPAYFSVNIGGRTAYRTLATVETSASLQMRVLEGAIRDLKAFQARYSRLASVCVHIEEAIRAAEAAMAREPEDA
jgi:hypothetical protein